jgi:nucleotide-binding universal stress UspA family protein
MNILILLKNSALDKSIVNFTTSVFGGSNIKLHLLNLVEVNGEIPTKENGQVLDVCTEFDLSEYHTKANENLAYLASFKNQQIESRQALVGNRVGIIQNYRDSHSIDLIVGGAHKTSYLEDIFVNTFASSIIKNVSSPFLTIKCNRDEFKPSKIGLIGDFLEAEMENLEMIKTIAQLHGSEIILIKIKTSSDSRTHDEIENTMRECVEVNCLNAQTLILDGTGTESGVEKIIQEHLVDLIAIERRHQKGLLASFRRDESTTLVNHVHAPILIC